MNFRWNALLVALVLAATPLALAQEADDGGQRDPEGDNDSVGFEDRVVDEESTIEDAPGLVYYIVIGAMSVVVFVGLLYLTTRYRKDRGSRPPP